MWVMSSRREVLSLARRVGTAGDEVAEVESTKATSPVIAPVSGKVVAVNEALNDTPELINQDPYGDGWVLRVQMKSPSQYGKLMTAQAYRTHLESEEG